jgi:hypothetical protein
MRCCLCGKTIPNAAVRAAMGRITWARTGKVRWIYGRAHGVCKAMSKMNREHRKYIQARLGPLAKKASHRRRKGKRRR